MLSRGLLGQAASVQSSMFLDANLPAMCGTSNEYSLSDEFVINLVRKFRVTGGGEVNPLRSERWSDMLGETEDHALSDVGYETARVTGVIPEKAHLFARAIDGTRNFFVRMAATDLSRAEFAALKNGQLLMVLPGDEPPWAGRAWPAKHVMLA